MGSEDRGVSNDCQSSTPGVKGQTETDTERASGEVPVTSGLGQLMTVKTEVV